MWQQTPGGWIWWSWNHHDRRWEQSWYADVPVVQWHPVAIERPASPKAGRRRRSRSRAQAPVTPPKQQPATPPKAKSSRVIKPKVNPDNEVVYVRVPFSLKDLPQGTYSSQLEWCNSIGVRFVIRHHGRSRTHEWDSSRVTLQGPQAHHAWSVLLKEYKDILPADVWKKVARVGIVYIRGSEDGTIEDEEAAQEAAELKAESDDDDSVVDFKEEPQDDVTKLPLQSYEKDGLSDHEAEDENETDSQSRPRPPPGDKDKASETERKQEPGGGGFPPGAGDGGSLPAVKVKEESSEVDYDDDEGVTAPAVPGEEPAKDDVPSPAEDEESEVEILPGGHVRLAAKKEPVSKFRATPKIRGKAKPAAVPAASAPAPIGAKSRPYSTAASSSSDPVKQETRTRFTVKRLPPVKLISRDGDLRVESDDTAPLVLQRAPVTEELQKRRQRFMDFAGSPYMKLAQAAAREGIHLGLSTEPERILAQMIQDWQREAVIARPPQAQIRISFCTVSYGRGWQLRITLPLNMIMMRRYLGETVRFIVVLYEPELEGCPHSRVQFDEVKKDFHDTKKFLFDNYAKSLQSGSLVVYLAQAQFFHSPKMKNLAHRQAILTPWEQGCQLPTGTCCGSEQLAGAASDGWSLTENTKLGVTLDPQQLCDEYQHSTPASYRPDRAIADKRTHLLINLDADNVVPQDYIPNLTKDLLKRVNLTEKYYGFRSSKHSDPGCTGRVGCPESMFMVLQGYDESFHCTGYQDLDFFIRCKTAQAPDSDPGRGGFLLKDVFSGWTVPNDKDPRMDRNGAKVNLASDSGLSWGRQNEENRLASVLKLGEGKWFRNTSVCAQDWVERWNVLCSLGGDKYINRTPPRLAAPASDSAVDGGFLTATPAAKSAPKQLPYKAPPSAKSEPPLQRRPPPPPQPTDLPMPRPPPAVIQKLPECSLRIVTCGIMGLSQCCRSIMRDANPQSIAQMADELHWQGKNFERYPNERSLLAVLDYLGVLGAERRDVLLCDLRAADDPQHDKSLRDHLGTHPSTLLGVAKQEVCKEQLKRVRRWLWSYMSCSSSRGTKLFTIVSYCKKGNHRSVAFAKLLQIIALNYTTSEARLSQMPIDVVVNDMEICHVTEAAGFWAKERCNMCSTCRHAHLTSMELRNVQNARDLAMTAWRQA